MPESICAAKKRRYKRALNPHLLPEKDTKGKESAGQRRLAERSSEFGFKRNHDKLQRHLLCISDRPRIHRRYAYPPPARVGKKDICTDIHHYLYTHKPVIRGDHQHLDI